MGLMTTKLALASGTWSDPGDVAGAIVLIVIVVALIIWIGDSL